MKIQKANIAFCKLEYLRYSSETKNFNLEKYQRLKPRT